MEVEKILNGFKVGDEGVDPLSDKTIQLAIKLFQWLQDAGFSLPDSVVPDSSGGIVFERQEKDISETFHIWDDDIIDYCLFQGARIIERRDISLE